MRRKRFEITLDGNEQFQDLDAFREQWEQMQADSIIRHLFMRLRFVEQPLHRDTALDSSMRAALDRWSDAPALIIDESDADLDSLPQAFTLGYSGTSHKNCKGITKSLINAARLAAHRHETGKEGILTGEDLANIGPVALLQDLAMAAMLGIASVERKRAPLLSRSQHVSRTGPTECSQLPPGRLPLAPRGVCYAGDHRWPTETRQYQSRAIWHGN